MPDEVLNGIVAEAKKDKITYKDEKEWQRTIPYASTSIEIVDCSWPMGYVGVLSNTEWKQSNCIESNWIGEVVAQQTHCVGRFNALLWGDEKAFRKEKKQ